MKNKVICPKCKATIPLKLIDNVRAAYTISQYECMYNPRCCEITCPICDSDFNIPKELAEKIVGQPLIKMQAKANKESIKIK